MDKSPGSPVWRQIRRLIFTALFLFVLAIIAGLIYLRTRPVPSPESIAEAGRKYKQVRALYRDAPSSTTLAAALTSNPTSTSLALQAECDRLALDLVNSTYAFTDQSRIIFGHPSVKIMACADQASALAAMYDKGVRLSPEALREFEQKFGNRIVAAMVQYIIMDAGPQDTSESIDKKPRVLDGCDAAGRARMMERIVTALKLMRVVDSPIPGGVAWHFRDPKNYSPHLEQQPVLPPELMNIDLELLAPRKPLDWDHYLGLELDYHREYSLTMQRLMNPPNAYQIWAGMTQDEFPDAWYKPIQVIAIGAGGAVASPRMFFGPELKHSLQREESIQQYAAAYAARTLDPSKIETAWVFDNEQISSRVLAGAIELRRGGTVPDLNKIGPDSYFFDPITQRPYNFYVSPAKNGAVYLHVRRPVAPYEDWDPDGQQRITKNEQEVTKIYLPANHPGLERVPKLK